MGVLAPVSAQRDTPLSPPSTSAEIFRRTCLQSHFSEIFPFSGQNRVILWGRGGPQILFLSLESSFFRYLGAHAKIWNPTTTPYGCLAMAATRKEEKKKKKNMQNSGLRLSDTVCTAPRGPIYVTVPIASLSDNKRYFREFLTVMKIYFKII